MPQPSPSAFPLADADLCVKCGLCLPHCPTYRLTQHEGDSPRGRIALMQGLVTGQVPQSPVLEAHLDGCLACRACEAVCPAGVPYGRLIDASREELQQRRPQRSRVARLVGALLTRVRRRRALAWGLWIYSRIGLQGLVRRFRLLGSGALARLESLLPPLVPPPAWQRRYPAQGAARGRVALFLGCVSEVAETRALLDGIQVLTRLGYEVHVPAGQACCGALHLHNGMREAALELARQNLSAFAGEYDAVLGTSSGCTATLKEYDQLLPEAKQFCRQTGDISAFLDRTWPAEVRLTSLPARAAVHEPCTLRNVLKSGQHVPTLLQRIPELKVEDLPGNTACCGAAGSYFLTEAEMADRLVTPKAEAFKSGKADYLVSSNIGCALHIASALRRSGQNVSVLHPVSLLAQQMSPREEDRHSVSGG